jgi:hypothetical protein
MPRPAVKKKKSVDRPPERSPVVVGVSRQLATLALSHRGRVLTHRQREELRRALSTAGDALGWSEQHAGSEDPVADLVGEVVALAMEGIQDLDREMEQERAEKKTEASRLELSVRSTRALAENAKAVYPAEISYSYTVRDSYQQLITRTATSTVNDAREALAAADALEKSIEGRAKLADLMVIELEQRRQQLRDLERHLPDFVDSSRDLLREVIENLS